MRACWAQGNVIRYGKSYAHVAQAGTPLEAAKAAGERNQDVFMGIDVFGRGTFAGGQLNSNVAAAAARQEGVKALIHRTPTSRFCL